VLADSLTFLNQAGFLIEPFGGTSYLLRAVPSILAVPDIRAALVDILEMVGKRTIPNCPVGGTADRSDLQARCHQGWPEPLT